MKPYSVIGIFCEDVRREASGQETIVGTLPDTLSVSGVPCVFPRLAVYIRAMFDVSFKLNNLSYEFRDPNHELIQKNDVDSSIISKAFSRAEEKNNPVAGLKTFSIFSPAGIPSEGLFQIQATVNDDAFICGVLKIEIAEDKGSQGVD